MVIGKTGHRGSKGNRGMQGIPGVQGNVGKSGSDGRSTTFVVISNQQVYDRLVNLEINNNQQHQEILNLVEQQNVKIESYKSTVSRFYWIVGGCVGLTATLLVRLVIM